MRMVYAIQHNKTKRIYVGCTSKPFRVRQHFQALKRGDHHSPGMQEDYNKHGDDFTAYLIEAFDGGNS